MIGRRMSAIQSGHPGELDTLDEFQGRSTAGGQVVDTRSEPELVDGRQRVAAADHSVGGGVRDSLRDRAPSRPVERTTFAPMRTPGRYGRSRRWCVA